MKMLFAFLPLAAAIASAQENLEQAYAAHGRLIITQFVSAPFPHPARADGHTYQGKHFPAAEHYSDNSVAIIVPKGFQATERVDFVIYFHGWQSTIGRSLAAFQLIEQFTAGGRNAVLVFPEGPRLASDSFGGKLEDADGFKRFVAELTATLRGRAGFEKDFSVGRVILAGHSGAYRIISAILDRGGLTANVREVWLFDGLYAETEKFLAWCDQQPGRFINLYTDGGGTKDDSEAMMDLLKKRNTTFLAAEESELAPDQLRTNKLIFIHTELGHNEVVAQRRQFALFLQTSALDALKP